MLRFSHLSRERSGVSLRSVSPYGAYPVMLVDLPAGLAWQLGVDLPAWPSPTSVFGEDLLGVGAIGGRSCPPNLRRWLEP